ncbi:MAG: xanthine dehydrogenase [Chloroflexi bacterium]|nr:xanthine dehydrogenase [Chloroflexota bacterium]
MESLESIYESVLELIRQGQTGALATITAATGSTPRGVGAKMLVYEDGHTLGTVGGGSIEARVLDEARSAMEVGRSRELTLGDATEDQTHCESCGGMLRVFIEVLHPGNTLLIVGAGHIGQALAELGAFMGFRVVVVDEREELVSPTKFPQAHLRLAGHVSDQLRAFQITERTHVVLVTPHSSRDEYALAVLAECPASYIGLLGSRRRTAATFERARALGIPECVLERIHTPIGLAIGAETPREIAISIMAEIVEVSKGAHRVQ